MGKCILCSAYQKFYSTLKSLDIFMTSDDFYTKVSSIDTFLSEFRSITLVLQKSIAHTEYKKMYEELREKYLTNVECTWLKNKRNDVLKEYPFELSKTIVTNIYWYGEKKKLLEKTYSYDNWDSVTHLYNDIKNKLKNFKAPEIYLSINIKYSESQNEIDFIKYIEKGLNQIRMLLNDFSEIINVKCKNCDNIKLRTMDFMTSILSRKMLLEEDYEYIPSEDTLKPKSMMIPIGISKDYSIDNKSVKVSLNNNPLFKNNDMNNNFNEFIKLYTFLYSEQNQHIMPTFFIFYDDNTFSIDSFLAESKSTFYRKINNIAENIENNKTTHVFAVWESYVTSIEKFNSLDNYDKRVEKADSTLLCFYYIDKTLKEKSTVIDVDTIKKDKSLYLIIQKAIEDIANEIKWQQFFPLKYGFAKTYHKYLNLENL